MNFLQFIHRSILDPPFYREVPLLGRGSAFFFAFKLVLLSTLISAIAHTGYVFSPSRGAIGAIATSMKGIAIKDGRLVSERPLPYEIPAPELNYIFSRIVNLPPTADTLQTPRVIIDTASEQAVRTGPRVIIRSTEMAVYPAAGAPQVIPYQKKGWYGPVNQEFTETGTAQLLKKSVLWIFLLNFFWDALSGSALITFCICMLALAAYIFRIERSQSIGYYFRIACFAIAPIPVGMAIIALSDATVPGAWRFLVIMSAVVMFRALAAIARPAKDADHGGGER